MSDLSYDIIFTALHGSLWTVDALIEVQQAIKTLQFNNYPKQYRYLESSDKSLKIDLTAR